MNNDISGINPSAAAGGQSQPKVSTGQVPGEVGIWVMVLGDMMIFSLFFLTFLIYRGGDIDMYRASRALLDVNLGAFNTLVLLTSSGLIVAALNAVRRHRDALARRLVSLTWLCGLVFIGVKIVEYGAKLDAGYTVQTNQFFMFYYIFTGIHLLHLLIGMGILLYMRSVLGRPSAGIEHISALESCAIFWHMVDLLWIVLFPLLYLVT